MPPFTVPSLKIIDLAGNDLTGEIPTSLGSLPALERLVMAFNSLSRGMPSRLGSVATLEKLNLNRTGLAVHVPQELGNLAKMAYLGIADQAEGQEVRGLPGPGSPAGLRGVDEPPAAYFD